MQFVSLHDPNGTFKDECAVLFAINQKGSGIIGDYWCLVLIIKNSYYKFSVYKLANKK